MKTRYRVIARRRLEAGRFLRRPGRSEPGLEATLDDPIEMDSEIIDLATGEISDPKPMKRAKRS